MRCEHCQAITKLEDEVTNQEHGLDELIDRVRNLEKRTIGLEIKNSKRARAIATLRLHLGLPTGDASETKKGRE